MSSLLQRNHTICLRFRKTHSIVMSTRNNVRHGPGIPERDRGIGVERDLGGRREIFEQHGGGQRRVELAAGGFGRAEQLGLVHLDFFEFVDRRINTKACRGDWALKDRRG